MRSRNAVQMAVVIGVALGAADARAHHSFAPHFDASKPVSISGTVTEYEARNPHSYVHIAAVDENGKTREYVCESHGVTQLTRNGITPELFKVGDQGPRHRLAVAAQSLHVLLRQHRVRGRPHVERQRSGRIVAPTTASATRAAQGHLRHLAARADRRIEARAARSR